MDRPYDMRNLTTQGKFLQPKKLHILYRYKSGGSGAKISVYGVGRDDAVPTKILNSRPLLDTVNPGLEAAMLFRLDTPFEVTDLVAIVESVEELAAVHQIEFNAMPEQVLLNEYQLTTP